MNGGVRFGPKLRQICPKWGQIRGFFQIRFSTFWRGAPKCTESDLEESPDFSHFGANLTEFGPKSGFHDGCYE